jgi:hypothetical protein
VTDWIALQKQADDYMREMRREGRREWAEAMQALRVEAYAAKDALHQIRGLIERQIGADQ